jgi:hypothetical protein
LSNSGIAANLRVRSPPIPAFFACSDYLFFLYLASPNHNTQETHTMKIEEIQQQCESLSNEQLLLVVNNKRLYTEKIVRVAYQEIKKRGLSKQEVKEIEKAQAQQSRIITGNVHEDIFLLEKIGFYFLGIFKFFNALVLRDYRKRGYILKVKQAQYYILLGVAFLFSSFFIGKYFHAYAAAAIIWPAGFLITHFFNRYYLKAATIKRLAARIASQETHD